MDSVFVPKSKFWIYPAFPFAPTENDDGDIECQGEGPEVVTLDAVDDSLPVNESEGFPLGGFGTVMGIKTEIPELTRSGIAHSVFLEDVSELLSDVKEIPEKVMASTLENIRELESSVNSGEEPVPSTSKSVPIRQQRGERLPIVSDVGPPKKKPKKNSRRKLSVVDTVAESESWEESLRKSLGMSDAEFQEFTSAQGFNNKSDKLDSYFDFGMPEPKGMPRFATTVPAELLEKSNTIRIYQNILMSSRTDGSLNLNAIDRAFYKSEREMPKILKSKKVVTRDPVSPKDMVITVDLHHPSAFAMNDFTIDLQNSKLPDVSTSVTLLASQTLEDLQTRLHCQNDLVYISEIKHPNDVKKLDWRKCSGVYDKNTFQTAAFVINDTIYTANVTPNYGQIISKWPGYKCLGKAEPFSSGPLTSKLRDLAIRPGYPYLYKHFDCEHLLVFTDIRTIHRSDPLSTKMYPRVTFFHNRRPVRCRVNIKHEAKFVVKDCNRLPEPLVPLCRECCLKFCYTTSPTTQQDIKVEPFQLYPLIQTSMLPISNVEL